MPTYSKELTSQLKKPKQAETWLGGFVNSILSDLKGEQAQDPTLGITTAPLAAVGPALRKLVPKNQVGARLMQEARATGEFDDNTLEALELFRRIKPENMGQLDEIVPMPPHKTTIKSVVGGYSEPMGFLDEAGNFVSSLEKQRSDDPTAVMMGVQQGNPFAETINTVFHEGKEHVDQVKKFGGFNPFADAYETLQKSLGGGMEGYFHPSFWFEREAETAGKQAEDALRQMIKRYGTEGTKFELDKKAAEKAGVKLRKLNLEDIE